MAPRVQTGKGTQSKSKLYSIEVGDWPPKRAEPSTRTVLSKTHASKVDPVEFKVGQIISAPHIEPSYDVNAEVIASEVGALFAKQRYMIVIHKFNNHMIALPIYTHRNLGIKHLHPEQKKEYVGLKWPNDDKWVNQATQDPVLIRDSDKEFSDLHYIRFTQPISVLYNSLVEDHGEVEASSLVHLQGLHRSIWNRFFR